MFFSQVFFKNHLQHTYLDPRGSEKRNTKRSPCFPFSCSLQRALLVACSCATIIKEASRRSSQSNVITVCTAPKPYAGTRLGVSWYMYTRARHATPSATSTSNISASTLSPSLTLINGSLRNHRHLTQPTLRGPTHHIPGSCRWVARSQR